jgi:hypothetical protein
MARVGTVVVSLLAAAALGMVALSLSSRGHPVALPLDDAYIYLQYAKTAAAGSVGSYTPGEPVTTGASGPLWLGLLAAAALGIRLVHGNPVPALPAAALILSMASTGLAFFLARRLVRRHGTGLLGSWTPHVLLVLTPYWLFAAFNGMETGLYGALLLGGAWAAFGGSPWWLVFLAAARPEGAVLAVLLLVVIRVRRTVTGEAATATAAYRLVPVVAAAVLLGSFVLSGGPPSAWEAKALWTEPDPELRGVHVPRLPLHAARILFFGLSGGRSEAPLAELRPDALGPRLWILFLGGGALLALWTHRGRLLLALWIAASLAALAAMAWAAHIYRYVLPAYPLLAVAAAAGWFGRKPVADDGKPPAGRFRVAPVVGGACLAGIVLTGVTGAESVWPAARRLYRGECERVAETQVRVGAWIREHLPPDARVATHDVGAIAFVGDHPVVDLVGLVTPEMAGAYRGGEGAMWEALESLPPERRPAYAAVIPAWMPYLSRSRWSGEVVWREGTDRARRDPVSRGFEIWKLSWPDADAEAWPGGDFGRTPRTHGEASGKRGWTIADGLDVADIRSEREHDARGLAPVTVVRTLGFEKLSPHAEASVAVDGGREVNGAVSFTLGARAGSPGLLVLRCTSIRDVQAVVRVGAWSGTLDIPRDETRFREPAVWVPAEALGDGEPGRVIFRVEAPEGYTAFHWWLLQPEPGL